MKRYDIKTTDTETLRKWYYLMSLGRALDEKAPSYLLQSLGWSYHAPYAGHDGIQLAIGQVFHRGEDLPLSLLPRYADRPVCRNDGGRNHPERYLESDRPVQRRTAHVQSLRHRSGISRTSATGTRPARRRCRPCNGLLRP